MSSTTTVLSEHFSGFTTCWNNVQGCRFVPYTFSETKPQMVPTDLNIGFQGLALIQGQIYKPDVPLCTVNMSGCNVVPCISMHPCIISWLFNRPNWEYQTSSCSLCSLNNRRKLHLCRGRNAKYVGWWRWFQRGPQAVHRAALVPMITYVCLHSWFGFIYSLYIMHEYTWIYMICICRNLQKVINISRLDNAHSSLDIFDVPVFLI